jgi:hypothetical protein
VAIVNQYRQKLSEKALLPPGAKRLFASPFRAPLFPALYSVLKSMRDGLRILRDAPEDEIPCTRELEDYRIEDC